jgi:hypothetical protein
LQNKHDGPKSVAARKVRGQPEKTDSALSPAMWQAFNIWNMPAESLAGMRQATKNGH